MVVMLVVVVVMLVTARPAVEELDLRLLTQPG